MLFIYSVRDACPIVDAHVSVPVFARCGGRSALGKKSPGLVGCGIIFVDLSESEDDGDYFLLGTCLVLSLGL